jgi:hypothetical protein
MATLNASITIQSPDVLSSTLGIAVGVSATIDSGSLIKSKVAATSTVGAITIYKANDKLDSAYVFIRNLNNEKEKYVFVFTDSYTDDAVFLKIGGGEFAFMPVKNDVRLKAYATQVDQIIEYGVFGLDSSSVTLS